MPLLNIFSALGLSSAAGLNAYIPLLILSLLSNRGFVHLNAPYDHLSSWWSIAILGGLCLIELIVDKVPGIDHINDIIQTAIRPTAGAILFASQAGILSHVHPAIPLALGLVTAGSIHAAKSLARPVINFGTVGIGTPILSSLENLISTTLAILAVLAPILCMIFLLLFAYLFYKAFRYFVLHPKKHRVPAIPVPDQFDPGPPETWSGGL